MPSDSAPRRLRRTPLGAGPPPPEALVRAGLVPTQPPIEVDGADSQVLRGTSNVAMDRAAGAYRDEASQAKPDRPPPHPHGVPFTLGK